MYVESGDFLGRLQGHLELETPTSLEESYGSAWWNSWELQMRETSGEGSRELGKRTTCYWTQTINKALFLDFYSNSLNTHGHWYFPHFSAKKTLMHTEVEQFSVDRVNKWVKFDSVHVPKLMPIHYVSFYQNNKITSNWKNGHLNKKIWRVFFEVDESEKMKNRRKQNERPNLTKERSSFCIDGACGHS